MVFSSIGFLIYFLPVFLLIYHLVPDRFKNAVILVGSIYFYSWGGPKFVFQDENLPMGAEGNYPEGTVAMWNKGPGTNGSQFFLVYADTTLIKANYTIWGTITEGLEIVKAIAKMGVRGGGLEGAPSQAISIEKVVISN
jgi:cyclophilin family peptidyl-prolyl cis-trans isomerase